MKRIFSFILVMIAAIATYWYLPESCPEAARRTAAIFVIAACSWAMEIFPHYGTSLLIVILLIFSLGTPGDGINNETFFAPFANPVIILFFGGFMMARALHKYDIDTYITQRLLLRFGSHPYRSLLGLMVTTAFLSMWISNTAATAIMLGIVEALVKEVKVGDPFRKGLILAIPFSANLGGIATPIGTPPNIIALGNLTQSGEAPSFLEWMMITIPLMLILLAMAYVVLILIFPLREKSLRFAIPEQQGLSREAIKVLSIFVFVVVMWLTSHFHGISEATIALTGAALFVALGLLDRMDVNHLDWNVLILMWGGLALSVGMTLSGLTQWIISLPLFDTSGMVLVVTLCGLAFFLSTFMSNTATAALLLPIAIHLPGQRPLYLAIATALSCSFAMSFPISTPPNALAFAKGYITTKDMLKAGLVISILSLFIMLLGFESILNFFLSNFQL